MGRHLKYVSFDRILAKVYRDLGIEDASETDLVEWAGEALEFMEGATIQEEAVCFIEIKDYEAELPNGLHAIMQVARNNRWSAENKNISPANIVLDCSHEEMENIDSENSPCGCRNDVLNYSNAVVLNCNGAIVGDHEIAYYRPYFDLQYEYHLWGDSHYYREHYTPVRLANNVFFNSIVCPEDPKIYQSCTDEYTLVGDKIRTSFKEGSIAIAYSRQSIDIETGYPMIPDDVSITNAIFWYIAWKYNTRLWMLGREGYSDKMQESEKQWVWYCKQSGNKHFMPHGIDQFQNLTESRSQLLPTKNKYYGFFGKLGRQGNKLRGT